MDKAQRAAHKADQDRIAAENEAQLARTENVQPTPTQEENDRAKLGNISADALDDKEADGSEEQAAAAEAPKAPAPAAASSSTPAKTDGKS